MYKAILKRAWELTWKYKILWLFGLFTGSMFGGNSRSTNYPANPNTGPMTQAQLQGALTAAHDMANLWIAQAQIWYQQYASLIWFGMWLVLLIVIVFVVVNVAARGGLVHLANEADAGREVRAGAGWRAGFSKWWRVFWIGFLASLPMAVVGLIVSGAVAAGVAAWLASPTPLVIGPDVISTIVIAAIVLFALSIIALFFGVTLGVASELGVRYAVLSDRGAIDSLRQGWRDLWAGRGAFKMFLVQLGVGILFAIAMGIVGAILMGPMFVFSAATGVRIANPAGAGLGFLLIVPAAVYAAFSSVAWTVFFRRMTAMAPAFAPVPVPVPEPMPSDV
jgi:hypothetical protein